MPETRSRRYFAFGEVIESQLEFPELDACDDPPAIRLTLGAAPRPSGEPDWFHHWYEDEAAEIRDFSVAREAGGYRMRFAGQADFVISADGLAVRCEPLPEASRDTLRHYFLDHVLPRMLGQRGHLILHASAVELTPGEGIAFVGKSGWGKSTLAASFFANGARLLSDDCLRIGEEAGRVVGIPGYGAGRLRRDAMQGVFPGGLKLPRLLFGGQKQAFRFNEGTSCAPMRIRAVFFLQDPAQVQEGVPVVRPMRGGAVAIELIRRAFLLDVTKTGDVGAQLRAAGAFFQSGLEAFSLQYPRNLEGLPAVREAVRKALNAGPADAKSVDPSPAARTP